MSKVFITIDTEGDRRKTYEKITTFNLEEIPKFQLLCNKYEIKPIYFCSYETVINQQFVDYITPFVKNGKIEIGTHLHTWTNPPFTEEEQKLEKYPSFATEYNLDDFEKKLKNLTQKIEANFLIKPVSYRAGRFGFDTSHIPILSKYGYRLDSSITPKIDWSNTKGMKNFGPDFSKYVQTDKFILRHDKSNIIEYPITIISDKRFNLKNIAYFFLRRQRRIWLRIFPTTKIKDLKYIINFAKKKIYKT